MLAAFSPGHATRSIKQYRFDTDSSLDDIGQCRQDNSAIQIEGMKASRDVILACSR